jgi:asparagine N-glycosylation enzyme membrane subunit Stt3
MINNVKKYWWIFALVFIFLFSYYIRAINIVPDRLLSFDPIFQYRFTKYIIDWGHLPAWDELSYYVGRANTTIESQFLWFATAMIYWFLNLFDFGFSLFTTASYASAIYGAMICIAAFLLGRELSNNYGGLMAAALIGSAPQILVRTFGSSYDTDQLVLFFIVLTTYLGIHLLRKRNISSFSMALIGFTCFMLTWNVSMYTFVIVSLILLVYFILLIASKLLKKEKNIFSAIFLSLKDLKNRILILIALLLSLFAINIVQSDFDFKNTLISNLLDLLGFAQQAESWIVNISIAELQPFSIFNLQGWIMAMGNIVTGESMIDILLLVIFFFSMLFGIFNNFKNKDLENLSVLLTFFLIAIVTTFRGVRFTEYTSAFFIILISVGFGNLIKWSENKNFLKSFVIGLYLLTIIITLSSGLAVGQSLGPDVNSNWDNAWTFLKTQTPEFSLVGTWWDPGHMITGLGERRVIADGAHCHFDCMYTINDRITDLGKIMATTDENVSLSLIRKYQGDSPEVYWIASDDLIGKYQWLQYFGLGCDARDSEQAKKCPLYMEIPEQSRSADSNGNIVLRNYGNIMVYQGAGIPIPIYTQDINGVLFDEILYYNNGNVTSLKFNETGINNLIQMLKPLETQLNFRFTNQSIPLTVWMPKDYSYIVIIPANLRDTVFTKMFMLEGEGLEHFTQVFRNEQVKIYKVI